MKRTLTAATLWLALALTWAALSKGHAQSPPAGAQTPPAEAKQERAQDCRTPGLNIRGERPLPRVLEAIKQRKVLKVISIGASSSGGRATGAGAYFADVETVLERTIPGVDVQIIDMGVSGELARDAGERIKLEVGLSSPDLVLWQLGTNDALAQISAEDFKHSVSQTLAWLKEHNVDTVLVGLHYLPSLRNDPAYQAIRVALRQLADEFKVLRVGRYEAMQIAAQSASKPGDAPPNEFALTESGYSCLAEYVSKAVTAGLFVRREPPGAPLLAPRKQR